MNQERLNALVKIKQLKIEAVNEDEVDSLISSGEARLLDAENQDLSIESRFDLAYNSSHAIALAALRKRGYRSENRYLVFLCLEHTLGMLSDQWRVLDSAHTKRKNAEYDGVFDVNEALVTEVICVTKEMLLLLRSE